LLFTPLFPTVKTHAIRIIAIIAPNAPINWRVWPFFSVRQYIALALPFAACHIHRLRTTRSGQRAQDNRTKRRPVHKGAGLHKEGRRRFGGILSLAIRYIRPKYLASGKHLI
jgi:hypothetical protein